MRILLKLAVCALLVGTLTAQRFKKPGASTSQPSTTRPAATQPATQPTVPQPATQPAAIAGGTAPHAAPAAPGQPSPGNSSSTTATAAATREMQSSNAAPKVPATPPRVSFQDGELTVVAENSSLGETLSAIRAATGIKIEGGTGGGDRVMAKIGPAPVRDVLLSLLEGSRYDFAMLGSESDPQKVDRLVLSPRLASGAPVTAPAAQPAQQEGAAEAPSSDDDDNEGFAQPARPAPVGAPETPGQVKTPEQLLEDLKKIESDKAQQQQQAQPTDPNAPRQTRPDRPK